MPDRRWSDADRELVARTWYEAETPDRRLPAAWTETGRRYREHADAVLDALTAAGWRPAREFLPAASEALDRLAARVRAETADGIAADVVATIFAGVAMPTDLRPPSSGRPPVSAYAEWAARIARAHRTTPGDDHG